MRNKFLSLIIISSVISTGIFMTGCNNIENLSKSGSILLVDTITGTDLAGNENSTTIFSDVLDEELGIVNDNATAQLRGELISIIPKQPSPYQDIVVDQIDITYSRSDIVNPIQGKDVPYSFSQKVNFLVPIGDSPRYSFVLIQHTAKLESPLVELRYFGDEKVLKLEANVTFYGKDLAGNRIAPVKTAVSVWCAEFGG